MKFSCKGDREWFAKGKSKISSKKSSAVVYVSNGERAVACGFVGKQNKPTFNYSFKTRAAMFKYAGDWIKRIDENAAYSLTRKAEKKAALAKAHGLKVGDVLRASWGYDQTNIDYYQVVELVGKRSVKVREIGQERFDVGHLAGKCVPVKDCFLDKEATLHRVAENDSVKVRDWGVWASKVETIKIAGKEVGFKADYWSAYH